MKYGSGGFNSYGYQAGCPFVNGTTEDALADPVAGQFLCLPEDAGNSACFRDFSGQGVCQPLRKFADEVYDDIFTVDLVCSSLGLRCRTALPLLAPRLH